MALIVTSDLTELDKERNAVHENVIATYSVFDINGKKYFQIDTYGRSSRKYQDKISQSIQFDIETAKYLIQLLKKEFDVE